MLVAQHNAFLGPCTDSTLRRAQTHSKEVNAFDHVNWGLLAATEIGYANTQWTAGGSKRRSSKV